MAPLLDAFDQPAVLVSTRGVAAFANITARRVRSELISRLPSTNMAADRLTRRSRVLIGGSDFELVIAPAVQSGAGAEAWVQPGVPPYLRGVLDGLQRGLSDKELALELGLTLSTARTYVTRCLRLHGVRSRRELMQRSGRSG